MKLLVFPVGTDPHSSAKQLAIRLDRFENLQEYDSKHCWLHYTFVAADGKLMTGPARLVMLPFDEAIAIVQKALEN